MHPGGDTEPLHFFTSDTGFGTKCLGGPCTLSRTPWACRPTPWEPPPPPPPPARGGGELITELHSENRTRGISFSCFRAPQARDFFWDFGSQISDS